MLDFIRNAEAVNPARDTILIVTDPPLRRLLPCPSRDSCSMALLALLVCAASLPLLTKYPAPGGDEPGFVDVALNVMTSGVARSEAYEGLLPGAARHVYWQPPLYFWALGGWMRVVGVGVLEVRLLSLLAAIVIVLTAYRISRRVAPPMPSVVAGCLLAVSFWLTNRASIARMDALCIALVLLAVRSYQRACDGGSVWRFAYAGAWAGLALLTHPLGAIAITAILIERVTTRGAAALRTAPTLVLTAAFAAVVALWIPAILEDAPAFRAQMAAQLARKQQMAPYWHQFWIAKSHAVTLAVAVLASSWLVLTGWRRTESRIVSIAFVVSFAAATIGREIGYFSYFYPFACCSVAVWLTHASARRIAYAVVSLAVVNELAMFGYDLSRYRHRDYAELTRVVHHAIPAGYRVFLGPSEVSPYFALVQRNPVRLTVPVATDPPYAHSRVAQSCEFIVATVPVAYPLDVAALINDSTPIATVDQGAGFRLQIFRREALPPPVVPAAVADGPRRAIPDGDLGRSAESRRQAARIERPRRFRRP